MWNLLVSEGFSFYSVEKLSLFTMHSIKKQQRIFEAMKATESVEQTLVLL